MYRAYLFPHLAHLRCSCDRRLGWRTKRCLELTDRSLFNPLHPPGTIENNLPAECFKGYVDPAITAKANAVRDAEKRRIAAAREALPPVETILGLDEFEVRLSFPSPFMPDPPAVI